MKEERSDIFLNQSHFPIKPIICLYKRRMLSNYAYHANHVIYSGKLALKSGSTSIEFNITGV